MKAWKHYLYWLYQAGCLAYAFYEMYSYSGLFRLAAEWQMDTFGSYDEKLTLLAPILVLVIPGVVAAKLLGINVRRDTAAALANLSPRILLALGLLLLAGAAGAGWLGYGQATVAIVFDAFDLSMGTAPPSNHVVMTGVAHAEYLIEFETKRDTSVKVDRYIPVTSTNWRPGEALVYFIKTRATAYTPPGGGRSFEFSQSTPPFPMTTNEGVLVRNGLPGPVVEIYRKHDIALAPTPVVFDPGTGADVELYIAAAVAGVLGGVWSLVAAASIAIRRRRAKRFEMSIRT